MRPVDGQTQAFSPALALRFLGVGNAQATDLGSSAAVLEEDGMPLVLIDCGPDTLNRFREAYAGMEPPALFITHPHFDHIGGLEGWFYRLITLHRVLPPKLYVPARLLPVLQRRIADYPNMLAEGGSNFWDVFQLIPVSERFWHSNLLFDVFPVRHHEHDTAFGLALKGRFLYTGDTRPIPEVVIRYACRGETIFHDCAIEPSPSHTAVSDIRREYPPEQWQRMVFYHYGSLDERRLIESEGFHAARSGVVYALAAESDRPVVASGFEGIGKPQRLDVN
jgi:ribonuclease BN (tRNA processing enzyme)